MPKTKKAKSAVRYGNGSMTERCGICRHFEPPHACEEVAGHIDSTAWCELFKRKPAKNK